MSETTTATDWTPDYQFGAPTPWERGSAATRQGYEAACTLVGIAPSTDADITAHAYGLEYAEYRLEDWRAMSREARVRHILDGQRLKGMEEEKKAAAKARMDAMVAARSKRPARKWGAGGVRYDEPCERCGRESTVDNDTGLCQRCGGGR